MSEAKDEAARATKDLAARRFGHIHRHGLIDTWRARYFAAVEALAQREAELARLREAAVKACSGMGCYCDGEVPKCVMCKLSEALAAATPKPEDGS